METKLTTDKKYELVPETITEFYCRPMYRIRALKDFSDVKKGDLGGYVESEYNLSQTGNCWIYDDSIVGLGARIIDNAMLKNVLQLLNILKFQIAPLLRKVHLLMNLL